MDDRHAKRSLADDPGFLASLSALDRGLGEGGADEEPPPVLPAPPPLPAQAAPHYVALPPSITSPFDALTGSDSPARPDEPVRRRPLLDLFPPAPELGDDALRLHEPAPVAPPAPQSSVEAETVPPPSDTLTYETFYGLKEKPFTLSSDPRFFYHSTPHDTVSQRLLTAIRKREGLVVLTGEIGAGKTMLCRTVIEQLDRRTLTSFLADPFMSGEELLNTILSDFGVTSRDELARGPSATRHELSTTLQAFVESLAPLQASAVVIVDEAQNLPPDVLEQVRILTEAADASPLLQVVLVGQPSLTALLRRVEHKALHQRVTVRTTLEPLPADEIGGYVMHRLAVAGSGPRIEFDEPALARIHRLSQGMPRVVNLLCDRALTRGCEASASVIDEALVEAAAEDLDLGEPRSVVRSVVARAATVAALALCVLIGAGVAAWVFRDAVTRAIAQWQAPRVRSLLHLPSDDFFVEIRSRQADHQNDRDQ